MAKTGAEMIEDFQFQVEVVNDAEQNARAKTQFERAKQNSDWLSAHWPELLPAARGKFVAVAGGEAFVGETWDEAWSKAQAVHPDDAGALLRYVRPEKGPRIYGHRG